MRARLATALFLVVVAAGCSDEAAGDSRCGDGVRERREECDVGLLNSDTTPNSCRRDCTYPICGDGVVDDAPVFNEACDPPDGILCDDSCQLILPNCGDGVRVSGEQCDDGDNNSNTTPNACRMNCQLPSCGDGVIDDDPSFGEACDPPDGVSCDDSCQRLVPPNCGDGVVDSDEQCDDANLVAGDGCDSTCAIEAGWYCVGEPSVCATICGDGVVAGQETCDDGNSNPGDGCATTCTVEPGWTCTANPSICDPVCGDGILLAGEGCDDGNAAAGDGCSPGCTVETNWSCAGEPSLCSCADWYRGPNCDICSVLVDVDPSIVQRDGLTWVTALATVQGGIDLAESIPGSCEVWVAEGTYYVFETIATDTIQLRVGVDVYGGFDGIEDELAQRDWQTHVTILSGWDPLLIQQVFHVVTGANTATLDGFTITGGFANTTGMNANGAGILNVGVSPTIRNCIIEDNVANNFGGGMYNDAGANPTVSNCSFMSNTAVEGGGLYTEGDTTVNSCTFDSNTASTQGGGAVLFTAGSMAGSTLTGNDAPLGGGIYGRTTSGSESVDLAGNTFDGNTADTGGGAYIGGGGVTLDNNVFLGNDATTLGGGVLVSSGSGTPTVIDCVFDGNTAGGGGGLATSGGPASRPDITNCTFVGNSATGGGGGMFVSSDSSPELLNVDFVGNTAINGGGLYVAWSGNPDRIESCLFSGNTATGGGGAIYFQQNWAVTPAVNLVLSNNTATSGGAVYLEDVDAEFIQCTLSGNTADTGGAFYITGNSNPQLVNLIVWGNTALTEPSVFVAPGATPAVTYCDIEGGFVGNGNIDLDPQFVDPLGGDYHLLATSPCIDTGDDGNNTPTDYDGNARIDVAGVGIPGTVTDMGALEYIP